MKTVLYKVMSCTSNSRFSDFHLNKILFKCSIFTEVFVLGTALYNSAATCHTGAFQSDGPRFRFLQSPEEAAAAIRGVLSADPRSVYRRTRCRDRLFFFTLDTAHITCWFGEGFAEVLQVQPVQQHIATV